MYSHRKDALRIALKKSVALQSRFTLLSLLTATVLMVCLCATNMSAQAPVPSAAATDDTVSIKDGFHIVGLPKIYRNERVDLKLADDSVTFGRGSKTYLNIPTKDIVKVEFADAKRHYGKATYAAAVATPFGVGALAILSTRAVYSLVLAYKAADGGEMNIVVQLPPDASVACSNWFQRKGVKQIGSLPQLGTGAPQPDKEQKK